MTIRIIMDSKTGAITSGDAIVGSGKLDSPTDGTFRLNDVKYVFFITGPFNQGYNVEIYKGSTSVAKLNYFYREGYTIFTEHHADTLDISNNILSMSSSRIGSSSLINTGVQVELDDSKLLTDIQEVLLLMLIDTMWGNRVGIFSRALRT